MRLTPKPLSYDDVDAFKTDLFNRKPFAERLSSLIINVDEPLVISLEADWGEGKTTFVHQWRKLLLEEHHIESIYFDAFAADIQEDAFTSLVAPLVEYLSKIKEDNQAKWSAFKDKTRSTGKFLAKIAYKTTVGQITSSDITEDIPSDTVKATTKEVDKRVNDYIDKIFDSPKSALETPKHFRDAIKDLIPIRYGSNDEQPKKQKIVFFIDELDRCRPDFSLDILEKVKHLFSIEEICFVIVNNPSQLQESIKSQYGSGTQANYYLQKFFTLSLKLPKRTNEKKRDRFDLKTYGDTLFNGYINHSNVNSSYWDEYIELMNSKNFSLRSMEKSLFYLLSVQAMGNSDILTTSNFIPFTMFYSIIKFDNPELFKEITSDNATVEMIMEYLEWESQLKIAPDSQKSDFYAFIIRGWLPDDYSYPTDQQEKYLTINRYGRPQDLNRCREMAKHTLRLFNFVDLN